MFDLPVEEIDRIEIVQSPGRTIWGANAVNSVINIITRKAVGNPREEVTIVAGTEERGDLQIRGGTELNGGGALRAFVRANGRDSIGSNGTGIEDRFSQVRVGLRADVAIDERTDLILRADATSIRDDAGGEFPIGEPPYFQNLPIDRESEGVNLLGRWTRNHDSGWITSLQGSYMLLDSDSAITITNRHQFDLWATHEFEPFEGHRVMGRASFRWWTVENGDSVPIDWDESFSSALAETFLQDRFQATNDLALTIGAKLEYSEYASAELQPQLRAAYTVSDDTTVWASVSHAVQTPRDVTRHSRFDFSAGPSGFPGVGAIVRSQDGADYDPEAVIAYELGCRSRVTERFKLDGAAFFNDYNRLGVPVLGEPFLLNPTTAIVPFTYDTTASATSYGAELVAEYALAKNLALEGAYSHIWIDEETPAGAVPNEYGEGESQHRLHIRCLWDIDDERQFDVSAYFNSGSRNGELGDVFRLDVRYGWRPSEDVEFVLMGQSLFQDDTPEDNFSLWTPVGYPQPGVYALVRFAF